ncbi:phage portal protein [Hyalangium versicolor]|uniref:phage portal protein n=1 Tax=Hyalangium versicolor TaxID=2861190 RepID=UPI001CCEC41C|nr:phage portal protein [Hyalangium versicolor]
MASLGARLKTALSRLLMGPHAGRPLVYAIPIPTFSPRRGSRAILDAYAEDGWLQGIVDTVADSVAAVHWRVYKPVPGSTKAWPSYRVKSLAPGARHKALKDATAAGGWVELPDHEVLRLLAAPHPKLSGWSWMRLLSTYLLLNGEAFLLLRRAEDGHVVGAELLPPHCVSMTPTPEASYYFISYNLLVGQVPESEMVWLKRPDPRNPEARGVGRGSALADEVDTREAIAHATRATFQRGGIAAAVVSVDSKSEDVDVETAVDELEKKYKAEHEGPDNTGKVWFVPGNATLAQVQVNFRELQMAELDKALRDYIRECFNVPAEIMGVQSGSTRATSEEAKYTLADRATAPLLSFIVAELNHKLVPLLDSTAVLEADDPRPESWERTHQVLTSAPNEGFSWNEVRTFAGYESDPALEGKRPRPLPGAQPVLDTTSEPCNPPPPRGPAAE